MSKGEKSLYNLSSQEAANATLGQAGSVFIDDAVQHTGEFVAITAITAATVDVSECTGIGNTMEDAADFVIPIGVTIFGRFAVFALDSGTVIAYYG